MARMIVVDRDGKEHDIEAKPGLKVMEILRELDYGVRGDLRRPLLLRHLSCICR